MTNSTAEQHMAGATRCVSPREAEFVFVVTCRNYAEWIEACLDSIAAQDHPSLGLVIADDASEDGSAELIEAWLARTPRFARSLFVRASNRGGKALRVVELMRELRGSRGVAAFLDGDDRLIHDQAARRMQIEFDRGADVAWSNFVYKNAPARPSAAPWPAARVGISGDLTDDFDPYRDPYRTSHLFCFRRELFEKIDEANFCDEQGAWFMRGCDQCFTLPLVYLAEQRAFVPEFFVEYNNDTPWQNPVDGHAAAAAVELVRARRFVGDLNSGDEAPTAEIQATAAELTETSSAIGGGQDPVISPFADGPATQIPAAGAERELSVADRAAILGLRIADDLARAQRPDGAFEEASFYAIESSLALWARCAPLAFAEQIELASRWMQRDWLRAATTGDAECHWEFKLYACTSAGMTVDPGLRRDNRRVLNWQLLLAVVDARLGRHDQIPRVLSRIAAQMDERGRIPDFDRALADGEAEFSDQYHAFSALLLDELARRDGSPMTIELSARASEWLVERVATRDDPNIDGRGRRQLFGYAAMLRLMLRLGEDGLAQRILDLLEAARWPDGRLPLCLDDPEQHLRPQSGWHGYNRWFDYYAWLGLHAVCDPMEHTCWLD